MVRIRLRVELGDRSGLTVRAIGLGAGGMLRFSVSGKAKRSASGKVE